MPALDPILAILRVGARAPWLLLTVLLALIGAVLVAPARLASEPLHQRCLAVPRRLAFAACARGLGVRITSTSRPAVPRGAHLAVANHQSYVDIPVLASFLPGHFIGKAEIRRWPLLGQIAALSGTRFVDRRRAKRRHAQIEAIAELLARGVSLIGFPESTTSDGSRVLPLRTGLFHAAALAGVPIATAVIEYRHRDGRAMDRAERARFSWHGDVPFVSHLVRRLVQPSALAVVHFGPLLEPGLGDRRALRDRAAAILAERFPLPEHPVARELVSERGRRRRRESSR